MIVGSLVKDLFSNSIGIIVEIDPTTMPNMVCVLLINGYAHITTTDDLILLEEG